MTDSLATDGPLSTRRSVRSCRLSNVKTKPTIEKKEEEEESISNDNDIEEEDPPEVYQLGDILWVRVPGNPWWPALVYGCYYEDNNHTKVFKTIRGRKRRVYFVYFFGPAFEYSWTNANLSMPYSGLEEFIRLAETSVQNASTKGEQEVLANRFELKVAGNKRAQWDKAIEEADQVLKLSREERMKNFDKILKDILNKAESKTTKKRQSSTTTRTSRKTSSPSIEKSSNRSSVKIQRTNSTTVRSSTALLHVGLPTLTKREEKRIINELLSHPKKEQLSLSEAQSFVCQLVTQIVKENSHYQMSCVQIEWFYDFLLNHPEIIQKYSHWFSEDIKPVLDDSIYFKQCQLKNMIQNSKK